MIAKFTRMLFGDNTCKDEKIFIKVRYKSEANAWKSFHGQIPDAVGSAGWGHFSSPFFEGFAKNSEINDPIGEWLKNDRA